LCNFINKKTPAKDAGHALKQKICFLNVFMFLKQKSNFYLTLKGFTLLELLVVIAIIGLLASLSLASINSARRRARAAKVISDVQEIEKALSAWGIDQGITSWWNEDVWGAPTDEPTISWLTQNTSLQTWLVGSPQNPSIDTNLYVYDNDDDTFDANGDGCADSSIWNGVNLNIWDKKLLDVADILDKMVDKSDGPNCGRIVWDPNGGGGYYIGYRLGNNSSDVKF
jgi:prepilin-type N-terminal cleavage/methylation domain-containing protein